MVVARLYIAWALKIWQESILLWLLLLDLYVLEDRDHYRGAIGLTNYAALEAISNPKFDLFAADSAFK